MKTLLWIILGAVIVLGLMMWSPYSENARVQREWEASKQRWHADCDPDRQRDAEDRRRCLARWLALSAYGKEHGLVQQPQ